MRRIRYNVVASLDGYVTDSAGGYDRIPDDSTVDFAALFERVDTIILGRRSYDAVRAAGAPPWRPEQRVYVVSRTLQPGDYPNVNVVDDPVAVAVSLRHEAGSEKRRVARRCSGLHWGDADEDISVESLLATE